MDGSAVIGGEVARLGSALLVDVETYVEGRVSVDWNEVSCARLPLDGGVEKKRKVSFVILEHVGIGLG